MSNLNKQEIEFKDSFMLDALKRLRVSEPHTLFESKLLYDKQLLFWDEKIINGGGSPISVHNVNTTSVDMIVGTSTGDKIIRQTKRCINYQPGKSMLVLSTFLLGNPKTGVRKRVGTFNENNGVFLQHENSEISFVIRSKTSGSVVETIVPQSSWNVDKLDGNGESGVTIDFSKVQLMIIDYLWLGVGDVRVGFIIGGKPRYVHVFSHSNILATVFLSHPNLPFRYEIENISTSASSTTIKQICTTIASEGGYNATSMKRSFDSKLSYKTIGATLSTLCSMRIKSTHHGATVIPLSASVLSGGNKNFYWVLCLNPTLSESVSASWVSLSDSSVEFDITRVATITDTNVQLASGYSSLDVQHTIEDIKSELLLGFSIDGVADELVLGTSILSASDSMYSSLSWKEML